MRVARALTNGSYVSRSSASFCSVAVPSFKRMPDPASKSCSWANSADDSRFTSVVGDVPSTWADATALERDVGYSAATPVESGVKRFVEWYLDYYKVRA